MKIFSFIWDLTKFMFIPVMLSLLFLTIMYTIEIGHVVVHEDVHSKIYEAYGIKSNISIDYINLEGKTTVSGKDYAEKCVGTPCQTLQEYNEIISYNSAILLSAIFGVGVIFLILGIVIFMLLREQNNINLKTFELLYKHLEQQNG